MSRAAARPAAAATARPESCARCGTRFECAPAGDCWCMAEPPRLPVPGPTARCLCPRCLREAVP